MSTHPAPRDRVPDTSSESRLLEIRREADSRGMVKAAGIRPPGAPFPKASPETGYYGIPLLKQPQWKWEVPLYFFVGGAAGSAAVIASMAQWVGRDPELARDARLVAAAGGALSSGLLIADLGRPARFLNMLRVFKKQSPMSVGAWVLAAFGTASGASAFAGFAADYFDSAPIRILGNIAQTFSTALALPFHNYTGVLIGATAIPVWNENIKTLPVHFGMSGLNAGVSVLELLGHDRSAALNTLGLAASAIETFEGAHIEMNPSRVVEPLKHGATGWTTRIGGLLSGPLPLALRIISAVTKSRSARRAASWSSIAGSIVTRYAWMQAGKASAKNWRLPLDIPEEQELQKKAQQRAGEEPAYLREQAS
jgi:Polysulphide reductase, NrfD